MAWIPEQVPEQAVVLTVEVMRDQAIGASMSTPAKQLSLKIGHKQREQHQHKTEGYATKEEVEQGVEEKVEQSTMVDMEQNDDASQSHCEQLTADYVTLHKALQ